MNRALDNGRRPMDRHLCAGQKSDPRQKPGRDGQGGAERVRPRG